MRLRMGTAADAAGVLAIYGPIITSTPISFEIAVPSEAEMAARIVDRQPSYPWLVADDPGGLAGYAYAGRFAGRAAYDWSVEVSVYVAEWARGRGIGRALYASLFPILAAQGYRRAMAGIALPNPASVALHEGCGFSLAGVYEAVGWKLGDWHDVGWWQRALGERESPPPAPVPFTDLDPGVLEKALGDGVSR